MHIAIRDTKDQDRLVYETDVSMTGLEYTVNRQEFLDQAWKSAVEDGAVDAGERSRYALAEVAG